MHEEIILIGGGGHCKSCIDIIEAENRFRIAGIVDVKEKLHRKLLDYEFIACDDDLPELAKQYKYFLITIGQIKSAAKRKARYEYLKKLEVLFPKIISPFAYVSKHAFIGNGTIIMHKAVINANAAIGENCIVNTAAIIEHDTKISDHCHITTGSVINGECFIGPETFVGSKSVISNNISVKGNTIIGAGSVVVRSIDESGTYAGKPAKRLKNA